MKLKDVIFNLFLLTSITLLYCADSSPDGAKWKLWLIKPGVVFQDPNNYCKLDCVDLRANYDHNNAVIIRTFPYTKDNTTNLFYQVCYASLQDPYRYSECFSIPIHPRNLDQFGNEIPVTNSQDSIVTQSYGGGWYYKNVINIPGINPEKWSRTFLYVVVYRTTNGKEYDGTNLDKHFPILKSNKDMEGFIPDFLYVPNYDQYYAICEQLNDYTPGTFKYYMEKPGKVKSTEEFVKVSITNIGKLPMDKFTAKVNYQHMDGSINKTYTYTFRDVKRNETQTSEGIGPFTLSTITDDRQQQYGTFTVNVFPAWTNPIGTAGYSKTDFPIYMLESNTTDISDQVTWREDMTKYPRMIGPEPAPIKYPYFDYDKNRLITPESPIWLAWESVVAQKYLISHQKPISKDTYPTIYASDFILPQPQRKGWQNYVVNRTEQISPFHDDHLTGLSESKPYQLKRNSKHGYFLVDSKGKVLWTKSFTGNKEETNLQNINNEAEVVSTPTIMNEFGTCIRTDESHTRYMLIDKSGKEILLPEKTALLANHGFMWGKYWCLVDTSGKQGYFSNGYGFLLIQEDGTVYKTCTFPNFGNIQNMVIDPSFSSFFFSYTNDSGSSGMVVLTTDGIVVRDYIHDLGVQNPVFSPSGDVTIIINRASKVIIDTKTGGILSKIEEANDIGAIANQSTGLVLVSSLGRMLLLNYLNGDIVFLTNVRLNSPRIDGGISGDGKEFWIDDDNTRTYWRRSE